MSTNAERQQQYRQRAASGGLVRLQTYIEQDVNQIIDDLAARFKKPKYAVLEYAVRELAKKYRLAESERERLS
jgi:hypothetical protein